MSRALVAGVALALVSAVAVAEEPPSAPDSAATSPGSPAGEAADDSSTAPVDSTSALEVPAWYPHPARRALRSFRLAWSVDREEIAFGDPWDPETPVGIQTLADMLRLSAQTRTREVSQGPTVESFGLDGGGSGRAGLLYRGRSLAVPGTSGPHSHELHLTEVEGLTILRGGAAALYGPSAVSGAVVVEPRHPIPDELVSRAVAEEGVDDYQVGGFHVARRLGARASMFASTESRRFRGFFPGTEEVDRNAAGAVLAALGGGWEAGASYRRYEGDGRHGILGDRSVLTKRGDYRLELFRPDDHGGGALLEAGHLRERLETDVLSPEITTREIRAPWARITADVPAPSGWRMTVRTEITQWRIEEEESRTETDFLQAAGAARIHRGGEGGSLAATMRLDGESHRKRAIQARVEGDLRLGPVSVFAVGSRGERIPDRGAAGTDNEVHDGATAGLHVPLSSVKLRFAIFASRVRHFRRDPTFEEVRSRLPVLDAPLGGAHLAGASAGFDTEPLELPLLRFLGALDLRSSVTWLEAELDGGARGRLPGRPRFTWTGEGALQRRLFKGELLAGLRGRLTAETGRVNDAGDPVVDLWLTDVLLDGRIGDAVFFFRFHDMLQRADEVEPGYRFPGFSRTYGISWRFVG